MVKLFEEKAFFNNKNANEVGPQNWKTCFESLEILYNKFKKDRKAVLTLMGDLVDTAAKVDTSAIGGALVAQMLLRYSSLLSFLNIVFANAKLYYFNEHGFLVCDNLLLDLMLPEPVGITNYWFLSKIEYGKKPVIDLYKLWSKFLDNTEEMHNEDLLMANYDGKDRLSVLSCSYKRCEQASQIFKQVKIVGKSVYEDQQRCLKHFLNENRAKKCDDFHEFMKDFRFYDVTKFPLDEDVKMEYIDFYNLDSSSEEELTDKEDTFPDIVDNRAPLTFDRVTFKLDQFQRNMVVEPMYKYIDSLDKLRLLIGSGIETRKVQKKFKKVFGIRGKSFSGSDLHSFLNTAKQFGYLVRHQLTGANAMYVMDQKYV